MKNVVIHKVVTFVFTEDQLKSHHQRNKKGMDWSSVTDQELIQYAKDMLENSSHSDLERHLVGHGWRTPDETKGKMIHEDDSEKDVHIEVIDTSSPGGPQEIFLIDRLLKLECQSCGFKLYVDDLTVNIDGLNCPSCKGSLAVSVSR